MASLFIAGRIGSRTSSPSGLLHARHHCLTHYNGFLDCGPFKSKLNRTREVDVSVHLPAENHDTTCAISVARLGVAFVNPQRPAKIHQSTHRLSLIIFIRARLHFWMNPTLNDSHNDHSWFYLHQSRTDCHDDHSILRWTDHSWSYLHQSNIN